MIITSTKNFGVDKLKMLVYAPSGFGKTTLAGTINEPTLIISAEAGLLSIAGKEIDVIDITRDERGGLIPKEKRIAKLQEVYQFLLTKECSEKYRWIFIDSLSEISQNLIEALNVEFPDREKTLVLYGENSKRMRSLIKSFRDIPYYNVLMVALAEKDKDEDNKVFMNISLVGNIASKVPAMMDEIFYLAVDAEGNRSLITSATDRIICKDRSGKLNRVEPANIEAIVKKIRA